MLLYNGFSELACLCYWAVRGSLTIHTPGQKLITRDRSNPVSKTRINWNVSPTFIFKFWHVFIYLKQRQKYITQKSILKFNKHNAPLCLRYSDLHTFVLQVQWQTYSCVEDPVIQLSLCLRFSDTSITKIKVQCYTYHCVKN